MALSRLARRLGVPVALTGQSIGPRFGAEVRPLVAELLGAAVMVGVREKWSYALAQLLGVPDERLVLGEDDAAALCSADSLSDAALGTGDSDDLRAPFLAVTLNDLGDAALNAIAGQLAEHSHLTGAGVVLVPHAGDLGGAPVADVAASHRVAAAFDARLAELGSDRKAVVVSLPSAVQAIEYCRRAELVISSRYHPVVFAGSCRTPMLFLYQDDYTAMKGIGALSHLVRLARAVNKSFHPLTVSCGQTSYRVPRALAGSPLIVRLPPEAGWPAGYLGDFSCPNVAFNEPGSLRFSVMTLAAG